MMKKLSALTLTLALVLALAVPAAAAGYDDAYAAEVLALTNAERAKEGLPALLANNTGLKNAAKKRAQEISGMPMPDGKPQHKRPNGDPWGTVLYEYPVGKFTIGGENLAYGNVTPAEMVDEWMKSPGHRANILGDFSESKDIEEPNDFTHIGIGVYEKDGFYYCAQLFLKGDNDGSTPPKPKVPFWSNWPNWIVFIIKWFLFGWTWMWIFS